MQKYIVLIFKAARFLYHKLRVRINYCYTVVLFYTNNIRYKTFATNGIPFVMVARGASCVIGKNLRMNNGLSGNPIGRPQPCVIFVDYNASLEIGENVGISATAIIAHHRIVIGDNVKIGGGVCIYDTDFHAIDAHARNNVAMDRQFEAKSPVTIKNNAFIGAHSTILKGVTIGENAVIGACSLVSKSVPDNEIWAGNPARFIKKIEPK